MSALHFACFHGHAPVVKLLLEYRAANSMRPKLKSMVAAAKNNTKNKNMLLPLIHVALCSFEEDKIHHVLELLIKANISLTELIDTSRRNIFHYLVLNRKLDLLKLVLSLGEKGDIAVAINDLDASYQTPLHLASGAGLKEYVTLLLANSAQPDVTLEACERSLKLYHNWYMYPTSRRLIMCIFACYMWDVIFQSYRRMRFNLTRMYIRNTTYLLYVGIFNLQTRCLRSVRVH